MIFYVFKICGYALAGSVTGLLFASTFQAFSTGLFQPSSVEYIRENIPHSYSATANSLMSGMPMLFSFFATVYFGKVLDRYSTGYALRILLITAVIGCGICTVSILAAGGKRKS